MFEKVFARLYHLMTTTFVLSENEPCSFVLLEAIILKIEAAYGQK